MKYEDLGAQITAHSFPTREKVPSKSPDLLGLRTFYLLLVKNYQFLFSYIENLYLINILLK